MASLSDFRVQSTVRATQQHKDDTARLILSIFSINPQFCSICDCKSDPYFFRSSPAVPGFNTAHIDWWWIHLTSWCLHCNCVAWPQHMPPGINQSPVKAWGRKLFLVEIFSSFKNDLFEVRVIDLHLVWYIIFLKINQEIKAHYTTQD